ncbi:hypothetical protein HU200_012790 [Digitaria exilis]|uniref:Uncharacterized protein n=1 Tax=Digitaria exilis TaxID=1010633 RepID=A0A835FER2_9POAL|nr:hypothetical protein HU200_012790 [Digitaria exilis]CAB3461724.1 unnamed protein product [Digitaria exilis]
MGKKRASSVSAAGAPVFPFPADAAAGEPDHFSDYGFDPQLVGFFAQPEPKRPSWSKRRHQPPPPLESARFKLQKPISKRQHHQQKQQQQRRRRWWSSAASAALLLFKRPCSSPSSSPAVAPAPPPSAPSASVVMPMYLADDDDDGGEAACACWAPAMRSGRLAAAELGASAALVPYVSLRSASLRAGGADGGAPAVVPMYLVT